MLFMTLCTCPNSANFPMEIYLSIQLFVSLSIHISICPSFHTVNTYWLPLMSRHYFRSGREPGLTAGVFSRIEIRIHWLPSLEFSGFILWELQLPFVLQIPWCCVWPQESCILSWDPMLGMPVDWPVQSSPNIRQKPGSTKADGLMAGQSPKATGCGFGSLCETCVHYSWLVICSWRDRLPSDISEDVHDLLEASEEI